MSLEQKESPPPGKRGFEDLRFYQEALELLKQSYILANLLPQTERYNMADQLRRSASSVTHNIAEGYGRYHFAEKLRFFYIARGSLDETLNGFIEANVVGYCDEALVSRVRALVHSIHRGLNGYIAFVRRQQQGAELFGPTYLRENLPTYLVNPGLLPEEEPLT
ncbi:MAG: four helix bundle protein [Chloroflexi bacterium]|nr:four helix bundle protein [Chloroflexota bacterium]